MMATSDQSDRAQSRDIPVTVNPHTEQRPFVENDTARYHNFTSGIGAGKTVGGLMRLARNVFEWNPGEVGMVVAPTVPALRNVILTEMDRWGWFDIPGASWNRTERRLELPNGSTVLFESADNDRKIERLRGPSIAHFWIDEAASLPGKVWKVMVGRLRTGQYRNASITTTPKGKNWVYRRFVEEADPELVNNVLYVPSTSNPYLPDDYAEITDEYDGRFYEQEVQGKFVAFEGLVYPWFSDEHLLDEPPDDYDEVIYGVDWGFRNPAVALAIVRDGDQWMVVDIWYERRCTTGDHANAVEELQDRWGPGPIYCDPSEPADIEEFQRDRLDARAAENDVTPGIKLVASLRDELRVVRSCQPLRNEFNQYQYKDSDEKDDPIKQNDHAMDGLRYALFSHYEDMHSGGGNVYTIEV